MKAILLTAPGNAEVLQLHEIAKPELPSAHHLRVKLAAAAINPIDTKLRTNPIYFPNNLPAILGCDGAGVVEETGSAVSRFKPGDEVYFTNGGIGDEPGNYAEYTTLHEDYCAFKPATLSLQDSAALPLVWITVWEALVERVNLQAGQTILIHAAAGGVGHIAVQLAHLLGARIAVTVSNSQQAGLVQGLGAEKIILYKEQDFIVEINDWTGGKGADVVFDTVGGETFLCSLNATRIGGKLVSILATPLTAADVQLARMRNLSLCYEQMVTPQLLNNHQERLRQRQILEHGAELVAAGKLGVLVSHKIPLEQAVQAHRLIEARGMLGKIVLTING